jgi:hypothetical protein
MGIKLGEFANTVRSKNAGVNQVTFDIIFRTPQDYDRARKSGALSREAVLRLFGIPPERMSDFVEFDVANAIKFTLYRAKPNGSPGDWDVLGCQQYGPLLEVEIP